MYLNQKDAYRFLCFIKGLSISFFNKLSTSNQFFVKDVLNSY